MSYNFVKSDKPSKHLPSSMVVPLTIPLQNNVGNVGYSNMIGNIYKPKVWGKDIGPKSSYTTDFMSMNYLSKMGYQNKSVLPENHDNNNKYVWKNNLGEQICNCIDNDDVSKIHNNSHMEQVIEDIKEANFEDIYNDVSLFNSVFSAHNQSKSCITKDKLSKVNTQVINNETIYTYNGELQGQMIKNIIICYAFDLIYKIKEIGVIYSNNIHDKHKISMDGNHLKWELLMNNENIYMGMSPEDRVFKFPIDFLFPDGVILKLSHTQTINFFIETTHNMGDEIKIYYNAIQPSVFQPSMHLSIRNIQAVTVPFQNKITLKLEGLTQYLLFHITPSLDMNHMSGVQLNRCVMKDYNGNIIFDYTGYEMSKIIPTMMFPNCKSPSWPHYYLAYFGDSNRNPIKSISSSTNNGLYIPHGDNIEHIHINNKVTSFEFEGTNIGTITIYNCTIGRSGIWNMFLTNELTSMYNTTFTKMEDTPNISKEIQICDDPEYMEEINDVDDFDIDQINGVDELIL